MTTSLTRLDIDCAETREQVLEQSQGLKPFKSPRSDGALPAPRKHLAAYDQNKIRTRADFAYTGREPKLLSYVDRLTFHSEVRQRVQDNKITNRLQMMGYLALRYLGTENHNTPEMCVAQVKQAREV